MTNWKALGPAVRVALLATGLSISTSSLAHHGIFVSYDTEQPITVTGTVTDWKFANPHVEIFVDVTDRRGETVNWVVEGSSVYYWSRAGWNRGTLRPGMEVTVTMFPARDGTAAGVISKIVLPDGREMEIEAGN